MNAIKLLMADHKEVERLFKECEPAKGAKKRTIFIQIRAALESHAYIEETIFYPTLQSDGDKVLVELTSEAVKEHMDMKCFLGELTAVMSDVTKFEPLLTKLIEDVRHHVKEEEGIMFPKVEKRFGADDLEMLGEQMQSEKLRFQASPETIFA